MDRVDPKNEIPGPGFILSMPSSSLLLLQKNDVE